MKKLIIILLLIAGFVFLIKKVAPSRAQGTPFQGDWTLVHEDGISGNKAEVRVKVKADKKRFRIESRETFRESVEVYDGETLHSKYTYISTDAPGAAGEEDEGGPMEPARSSEKISEDQAHPKRFWARSFPGQAKAGPGGLIAGRETVLYQGRENRPEGEMSFQAWVDAKTGIVLKEVSSIYSAQIEQIVTRNSEECQSIQYGSLEASVFAAPQ